MLYAVIYGQSNEDIVYFSDPYKAAIKLVIQTNQSISFHPVIRIYVENNSGVYVRTKEEYQLDLQKLTDILISQVSQNPEAAFSCINNIDTLLNE